MGQVLGSSGSRQTCRGSRERWCHGRVIITEMFLQFLSKTRHDLETINSANVQSHSSQTAILQANQKLYSFVILWNVTPVAVMSASFGCKLASGVTHPQQPSTNLWIWARPMWGHSELFLNLSQMRCDARVKIVKTKVGPRSWRHSKFALQVDQFFMKIEIPISKRKQSTAVCYLQNVLSIPFAHLPL